MSYHLCNLYIWLIVGSGKIFVELESDEKTRVYDLSVATLMVGRYIENKWIPRIMYKILAMAVVRKLEDKKPGIFKV